MLDEVRIMTRPNANNYELRRGPVGDEVALIPLLPQRIDAVAQRQERAVDVGPLHQPSPSVLSHRRTLAARQIHQR